jgi:hypothetical protein
MNRSETEIVTLQTDTGAVEKKQDGQRDGRQPGGGGCYTDSDGGGNSSDEEKAADSARLLESGAVLHALSADEGDGNGSDEEMDGRDLTPEEAAAATAVLDAPDDDNNQEGLALTGGDWFNTIKNAVINNKEAEKELAARMKKAKISQTSLENEVFEGEHSNQSSADASPGLLQKNASPPSMPHPPPSSQFPGPPLVNMTLNKKTEIGREGKVGQKMGEGAGGKSADPTFHPPRRCHTPPPASSQGPPLST